jgi:hypothetical protein
MRIEDTDKAALGHGLGKGKVTNSEVERGINQNVLEFDVPMNDALVEMEVRKSRNELPKVVPSNLFPKWWLRRSKADRVVKEVPVLGKFKDDVR